MRKSNPRVDAREIEWNQFGKVVQALAGISDDPETIPLMKKVTDVWDSSHIGPTIALRRKLEAAGIIKKKSPDRDGIYELVRRAENS